MSTFKEYRQACLHALQDQLIPFSVCTTTAQSGDGTTLVDTARLADSSTGADTTVYERMWAYLLAVGYTGQTVNETRRVKKGGYAPSTGILTLGAAFGGTPLTGKPFEIHKYAPPEMLERAINYALRHMRYKALEPLTLVSDGMMASSATTAWTAGGGATLSKVTTAAYVYSGLRSLRVQNAAANEYAQSTSVPVVEKKNWTAAAIVQCSVGTAKLVAYDVTNGAEIDSWVTTQKDFVEFREPITIPSGCKQAALRLQGVEATADIYWDSAILLPSDGMVIEAPSWVERPEHVENVSFFPLAGTISGSDDGRVLGQYEPVRWRGFELLPDTAGAHPYRLRLSPATGTHVPWLLGYRPYAELSADTDTSTADIDDVVPRTLARFFSLLGPTFKDQAKDWRDQIPPQRPNIVWRSAYG